MTHSNFSELESLKEIVFSKHIKMNEKHSLSSFFFFFLYQVYENFRPPSPNIHLQSFDNEDPMRIELTTLANGLH